MNLEDYKPSSRHQFDQDDYESIRDVYYACLEWSSKRTELIEHVCFFITL